MIISGYDTDDLTDRQNHYFYKLKRTTPIALSFLKACVNKNFRLQRWDNYEGDCDWLLHADRDMLHKKFGIDVDKLYE